MEWPQKSQIDFNVYKTRYREGLDLVLRGITCTIAPSEKVSIAFLLRLKSTVICHAKIVRKSDHSFLGHLYTKMVNGNELNKFNNTGARILDTIYHMTLKLLKIAFLK